MNLDLCAKSSVGSHIHVCFVCSSLKYLRMCAEKIHLNWRAYILVTSRFRGVVLVHACYRISRLMRGLLMKILIDVRFTFPIGKVKTNWRAHEAKGALSDVSFHATDQNWAGTSTRFVPELWCCRHALNVTVYF